MTLDMTQRNSALAHLGIAYTQRGDTLTVHGDEPSEQELETAYVEWEAAEAELAAQPTVDDVTQAILILAEGDDTMAKRIKAKADEIAQERVAPRER